MPIIVRAGANDTTDSLIRKFQKKIALEGVIQEYRDLEFHKTATEKRKERLAEKARKIRRAQRYSQ